jgi:hypothetical protein
MGLVPFRFDGQQALDYLLAIAGQVLIPWWDGTNQKVAFVLEHDGRMMVGYWPRSVAPVEMRRLAEECPRRDHAETLRAHATTILAGPPASGGVHCLLYGWTGCELLELDPGGLAGRNTGALTPQSMIEAIEASRERDKACALLGRMVGELAAATGAALPALHRLVELLADRWDDPSALAVALGKARDEGNDHIATAVGQRLRIVLNALTQAVSDRGGFVNTHGTGSA